MTETETTEIGQKQLRKTSKNMSETHPTGNIAHQDGGEGDTQSSDYNESDEEVDTKCKCHECGLGYKDTPDQRWLYCAICNNIFDINCQKISKTRHDSLKHENCFWICTGKIAKVVSLLQNVVNGPRDFCSGLATTSIK